MGCAVLQTVQQDACYHAHIVFAIRLRLDNGSQGEDFINGISHFRCPVPHLFGEPVLAVVDHFAQGDIRVLAFIEIVGIRE